MSATRPPAKRKRGRCPAAMRRALSARTAAATCDCTSCASPDEPAAALRRLGDLPERDRAGVAVEGREDDRDGVGELAPGEIVERGARRPR